MSDEIPKERPGPIEILTLNRPKAPYALTYESYGMLERAVHETSARCLIITGADPAFCSGDDVKPPLGLGEATGEDTRSLSYQRVHFHVTQRLATKSGAWLVRPACTPVRTSTGPSRAMTPAPS